MPDSKPTQRVLICEDESILRIWLRRELQQLGFEVVGEARSGDTAVQAARDLQPDIIFMDIKMPVLDGISASSEIMRRRPVPILILTAYGEKETVNRALLAGVSWYLVKPIEARQLYPAIVLAKSKFDELNLLRGQVASLEDNLEQRKLVERAKGILMRKFGLDESGAHQLLQRLSSHQRQPLKEIARQIIEKPED